ncbi:helix-turn-helix domain-containing protein [Sinomicrobium kalidii]|uniref:two-component regulator propeller domain-containing protein n=1 Tax=Sinomicrobium kalidii TaxID=2900738 RepID=UPI001E50E100|nr:two-component regulator propeller domain-containing protein [Sinomicrobium kalidii]UGU16468.1 helix-turn-helix domain-containing protein [Sinomicrobium kalidii]
MKFNTFTTQDGLSNNSVNDIISDRNGMLWIGTWDGLNSFDGQTFTVYKHDLSDDSSIAGNVVSTFVKDEHQNIWMLTDNKAVSRYMGDGKFKNHYFDNTVHELFTDSNNVIWARSDSSYFRLQNGKFAEASYSAPDEDYQTENLKNILWSQFPDLTIKDILKDDKGNIWYATREEGLFILPNTNKNIYNEQFVHYTYDLYSEYSFKSNDIEKLYEDSFNNIWLAHKDGGISMVYKGSENINTILPHPHRFPHLPNETIRAITKDHHSKIWLGYYTKGLYYYSEDSGCYLHYPVAETQKNPDWGRIRSLHTAKDGSVWVGTYAGLIHITGNTYQLIRAEEHQNFPDNRNYAFFEEEDSLWIACWGGLALYNKNKSAFEYFPGQEKLDKYHFRQLVKNGAVIALASENHGMVLLNTLSGNTEEIDLSSGLTGNSVYYIYKDPETGYYWIATLGGITIYDLNNRELIRQITEEDGLPSHMVYSLLPNRDALWISTTKGIASVDKRDFSVTTFPPEEGWQGAEFSEGSYYQDNKGILYFGGIHGLNYFQPEAIVPQLPTPKLKIKIDNKENYTESYTKSYTDNSLQAELTPIYFSKRKSPVFYQLEGHDKTWIPLKNTTIHYDHLQPGSYRLLVRRGDDTNALISSVINLKIEPPFYKASWFFTMIIVIGLSLILIYIYRKNRISIRNQKKLEEKIQRRTQTIEAQKNELVSINKDLNRKNKEISDQKNQLLRYYQQLKDKDFEIEKFKTFILSEFKPPIHSILNHIETVNFSPSVKNQLLDQVDTLLQVLEEWKYLDQVDELGNLHKVPVKFKDFAEGLTPQFSGSKTQLEIRFSEEEKEKMILLDSLRFKLLFRYITTDLLKYIEKEHRLFVEISLQNKQIRISLSTYSNMVKMNWESISLFSPYYRAFHSLVRDMDGKLNIDTQSSTLQITIQLPVVYAETEKLEDTRILWKHLNTKNHLPKGKKNILVYCAAYDITIAQQLLEGKNTSLIFENEAADLQTALKQLDIHALVIYDLPFSNDLIRSLQQKDKRLPGIYISESLNVSFKEHLIELGIDSVINLPTRKHFIVKTLHSLLQKGEDYQREKSTHPLVIDREDEEMMTPHEKLAQKGIDIIQQQLGNPSFNVEQLIADLEISRAKCYRIFKEVFRQAPSGVIHELRLQKSSYLLQKKGLNISEISFECGFNDPKYFSKAFKKRYGRNPRQYRNQKEIQEN